jgi:hypothetical protein
MPTRLTRERDRVTDRVVMRSDRRRREGRCDARVAETARFFREFLLTVFACIIHNSPIGDVMTTSDRGQHITETSFAPLLKSIRGSGCENLFRVLVARSHFHGEEEEEGRQ